MLFIGLVLLFLTNSLAAAIATGVIGAIVVGALKLLTKSNQSPSVESKTKSP